MQFKNRREGFDASAIKLLEKQRSELQADIQEAYQSDDAAEAMQQKVRQKEMERRS
ncbi:hypothetical protein [Peribacillus sp. NPDC096540]|uniref:hypothetical protein n=1 Tax=Peribacillus sp. NPDC096540 TaxID=3390612 RepID=UPI003D051371